MTSAEQGLILAIIGRIYDQAATPELKHSALQVALILESGLGQLSPGACFLRMDLFPPIVDIRPFTADYSGNKHSKIHFEAMILLALLANFHRSDTAHQKERIDPEA